MEIVDGGNRDRKYLRAQLIQASSQTPVELVQRRLINLLALAGASFSFLPVDLMSGQSHDPLVIELLCHLLSVSFH